MSTQINFLGETIKRGLGLPQGQYVKYKYDPARGFSSDIHWKGISQTQLIALYNSVVSQGIACELNLFEDEGELTAENSTLEFTIDSWEFIGADEKKFGLSHPTLQAIISNDSPASPSAVMTSLLNSLQSNDDTDVVATNMGNFGFNDADTDAILGFYYLQQSGATDYDYGQYSVRHKTNVSNRWQINVSDIGVKQIYTPAQFLTEVSDSGVWIFPMPPRLQFKASFIPPDPAQPDYLWGWLKSTSTESNAANNRVDIVTDYVLQNWSTYYYTPFAGGYGGTYY
jgi:hypothetical protein